VNRGLFELNSVTFPDRDQVWQDIETGRTGTWDIVIIGGGITGAGILREAVRNGYRTLLVEQRDFAWGSSSRSSKMVHGGIRYLASGKISLTRHALQERENLVRQAPNLVERLGYYFPLYKKRFPPGFAAGLLFWLYDRLAGTRDHHRVSNGQLAEVFRELDTSQLNGAFYYTDAVTDDARLTLRVLQESIRHGGIVRNYTRANELLKQQGQVNGVLLEDRKTGKKLEIRCSAVINATGAWADRLGNAALAGMKIRPQRGSHLILSAERFPVPHAIFIVHPTDGRRVFIYPWEGRTVVGMTDIFHDRNLDHAASMTRDELVYLLHAAAQLFPVQPPAGSDVISSWSGVRPIITSGKSGDPSRASREHQVWVEPGLVSCSGGKLTTFHHMALDVISKAKQFLPARPEPSETEIFRRTEFTGADVLPGEAERGFRLLGRYGDDAVEQISGAPLSERAAIPGTSTCLAQVRWALQREAVVHLDDVMLRRTRLGLLLANGGEEVLGDIGTMAREICGWSGRQWDSETDRYLDIIRTYYTVPGSASD
jgi:glycerol-3-phosphate dehydrogenase